MADASSHSSPPVAEQAPAPPPEQNPPYQPPAAPEAKPAGPAPADPAPAPNELPAAFNAAKDGAAASRAQAQDQPLLSVPLKQLLDSNGHGVHLLSTHLGIKVGRGEYSLSVQPSRLGVEPETGYVVIYRNDLTAPVLTDLRGINADLPAASGLVSFFRGSTGEIVVGGRKFGVALHPADKDIMTVIDLWPGGEEAKKVQFTVADGLAAACSPDSVGFKIGSANVKVISYQDYGKGSGSSIALCTPGPGGDQRRIPTDLLTRSDGKLVSISAPKSSQRLGLRIVKSEANQVLEIYDLAKSGKSLGEVPIGRLVKGGEQ